MHHSVPALDDTTESAGARRDGRAFCSPAALDLRRRDHHGEMPHVPASGGVVGASAYRPFCSERCRLIDMGAWLTEQHKIPDEAGGSVRGDSGDAHSVTRLRTPDARSMEPDSGKNAGAPAGSVFTSQRRPEPEPPLAPLGWAAEPRLRSALRQKSRPAVAARSGHCVTGIELSATAIEAFFWKTASPRGAV